MSHATQAFTWYDRRVELHKCKAGCYCSTFASYQCGVYSTTYMAILHCVPQSAGLSNFAWGHECSRQDTLSGLAVKYGVTPLAIKMTNNLISDQGLQIRHIVYVPGEDNTTSCACPVHRGRILCHC